MISRPFFFFNDTATTEIYTLSLHDALPIYTLKVKIISVTFRRVIRTNHKKASKSWRLFYGRSEERFSRNAETELVCRLLLEKKNITNETQHEDWQSLAVCADGSSDVEERLI